MAGPIGRECVERLAQKPLSAGLAYLPVPGGDVVAAAIPAHVLHCLLPGNMPAAAPDYGDQFGLEIDFLTDTGQHDRLPMAANRRRKFAKQYWFGRRFRRVSWRDLRNSVPRK